MASLPMNSGRLPLNPGTPNAGYWPSLFPPGCALLPVYCQDMAHVSVTYVKGSRSLDFILTLFGLHPTRPLSKQSPSYRIRRMAAGALYRVASWIDVRAKIRTDRVGECGFYPDGRSVLEVREEVERLRREKDDVPTPRADQNEHVGRG